MCARRRRMVGPGRVRRHRFARPVGDGDLGLPVFPGHSDSGLTDLRISDRQPAALRLSHAELRTQFDAGYRHPHAVLLEHRAKLRLHDFAAADEQAWRAARQRVSLPRADFQRHAALRRDPGRPSDRHDPCTTPASSSVTRGRRVSRPASTTTASPTTTISSIFPARSSAHRRKSCHRMASCLTRSPTGTLRCA